MCRAQPLTVARRDGCHHRQDPRYARVTLSVTEARGHEVDLTIHRRRPQAVAATLTEAGFHVLLTTVHEPGSTPPRMIAREPD